LRDDLPRPRAGAATALGRIGGDEAVTPLRNALDDEEAIVRASAAIAIGRLGGPEAELPLKALLTDDDEQVRQAATHAIDTLRRRLRETPEPN
jgi:HEAT repeat protein